MLLSIFSALVSFDGIYVFTNVVNLTDMHYCFSKVMHVQWLCTHCMQTSDLCMLAADQHTLAVDLCTYGWCSCQTLAAQVRLALGPVRTLSC